MSNANSNGVMDAIRGGQIIKHYIAMFKQVFWWIFGAGSFFFISVFMATMFFKSSKVEFFAWLNWVQSWYLVSFLEKPNKSLYYFEDFGNGFEVKAYTIYVDQGVNYWADAFVSNLVLSSIVGGAFFIFLIFIVIRLFSNKGKSQIENELIRGGELVDVKEMASYLKKLQKSDKKFKPGAVDIGGVKIPLDFEPQGFAVFGSPGSGKTQLYTRFCDGARRLKQRAIINDRSGTLVEKFYREGDIILNPLDTRCAPWSLFNECHHKHDFDRVANILFSKQSGDPFWYEAPRLVFVSLAMQESKNKMPSIHRIAKKVLTCSVDELVSLCANTLAQTLIDKDTIKQTNSLRSVIVTKLQAFLLFEDHISQGFSIRDWIHCEDHDGWIFITSNKDQEASLRPLITSWLEIASSSILSLKPDLQNRIWLWFDELHTLDKVETLASTLAELRKYGGCAVIGFQGAKQAVEIYGVNGLDALMDSCSTHIFFRQNNEGSASYASKQIGKADMYESTSNLSYGASDVRDGQQHGQQRHLRELVLPSEIQGLPDLTGYIRFGKSIPIVKFKLDYITRKDVAPGFIEDTAKLYRLDEIVTNPKNIEPNEEFDESDDRFNQPEKDLSQSKKENDKHVDPLGSFDIPVDSTFDSNKADAQAQEDLQRFTNEPLDFDMGGDR